MAFLGADPCFRHGLFPLQETVVDCKTQEWSWEERTEHRSVLCGASTTGWRSNFPSLWPRFGASWASQLQLQSWTHRKSDSWHTHSLWEGWKRGPVGWSLFLLLRNSVSHLSTPRVLSAKIYPSCTGWVAAHSPVGFWRAGALLRWHKRVQSGWRCPMGDPSTRRGRNSGTQLCLVPPTSSGLLPPPQNKTRSIFALTTHVLTPKQVTRIVLAASWVKLFREALLFRNQHQRRLWRVKACYETCNYLLGRGVIVGSDLLLM